MRSTPKRKEILAVLPVDLKPAAEKAWLRFFQPFSQEWQVHWIRAPRGWRTAPKGQPGLYQLSIDTIPAMCRLAATRPISAVFLIGGETVASCVEPLRSLPVRRPYIAVLDKPWPPESLDKAAFEVQEFLLARMHGVLLTSPSLKPSFEPYLRRADIPVEVMPRPGAPGFAGLLSGLSSGIDRALRDFKIKATASLIGVLPSDPELIEPCLEEWRQSLPPMKERVLIVPAAVSPSALARLQAQWPGALWLRCASEKDLIRHVNGALTGLTADFAVMLTPGVRVHPVGVEHMLACGRRFPLAGLVSCGNSPPEAPSDPRQWHNFVSAWSMRFRGSFRLLTYPRGEFFLLNLRVYKEAGAFDERLNWLLAVCDYVRRLRQAGLSIVLAEDAVAEFGPLPPYRKSDFLKKYLRKWALDPLLLAREHSGEAVGGRFLT